MSARDVALIAVMLFAVGLASIVFHYSTNIVYDKMINNSEMNESQYTIRVFNESKALSNRMDYVFFIIFIGFCLALIISGWFVSANAFFAFIYFIFLSLSFESLKMLLF